jgi:hypothetical protein
MAIFMTHILETVQHLGLKFQNILEDGYDSVFWWNGEKGEPTLGGSLETATLKT